MNLRARVLVVVVAVLAAACGSGLSSAKSDYKRGRLAEAKTQLLALEDDSQTWTGTRRAEYALYRGLVHAALGERAAAGVWLREAKAVEDIHPHTLGGEDKARLDLALEALATTSP